MSQFSLSSKDLAANIGTAMGEAVTYLEKDEAGDTTASHAITDAPVVALEDRAYEDDTGRVWGRAIEVLLEEVDVTWTPETLDAITARGEDWTIVRRHLLAGEWVFVCVRNEVTHKTAGDTRRFRNPPSGGVR